MPEQERLRLTPTPTATPVVEPLEPGPPLPFQGTAFITSRLIESSDPSSLRGVTCQGRGYRQVFDRRVDGWVTVDAFLFDADYGAAELAFQVNPEFGDEAAARSEVDTWAPAVGRLPAVLLSLARVVQVKAGKELFDGNVNGSFLIHTGQGEEYIRYGFLQ